MDAFGICYLAIGSVIGLGAGVLVARDPREGPLSVGACALGAVFAWPLVAVLGLLWLLGKALTAAAGR